MTIISKIFRNFKELFLFIVLIFFAVLICVNKKYSASILYGLELWIICVLPALLPYFFITAVLSSLKVTGKLSLFLSPLTKKFFNVNGSVGYAFLISIISGYPIGAKIVSDLRLNNVIGPEEAVRASALCSTSSPTFLIASVGGITFQNTLFGALLFLCHIISALITGLIFSRYKYTVKPTDQVRLLSPAKTDNVLGESVYSAVTSVLNVGGLIALFYLFTDVILDLRLLYPFTALFELIFGNSSLSLGLTTGIIECTRGIKTLASAGLNFLSLPLTAFLCGFGGLSIIAQSLTHLKKAKIKTAPFILAKITSAVINFIIGITISVILF